MLAKQYRFQGLGSVRPTMRHGQTMRGKGFRMKYHPSQRPHSRFAVVVSKKVSKRAVVRNRIRRRVFAVIATLLDEIDTPHDVVISVYDQRLADRDWNELKRELTNAFRRAHIVN